MAAVYQYDVHYDENGKWVDIDNTFEEGMDESEAVYQNVKNETFVKFMKKSNENKLYTFTKGDYRIKVSIEGVSKAEGVVPKIVDEETGNEPYRLEGINS